MSDKNKFANVQRLNSTVMAKCEWTSSLIGMRKSGEEIHDRRTKTHRKANQFLQDLLEQRSDGSSFDDNGVTDRYHRFLRNKSNLNDDGHILDEFDRRLRSLNHKRRNQTAKTFRSTHDLSMSIGSQANSEIETDTKGTMYYRNREEQYRAGSKSTLNNIDSSVFSNISPDENQTNVMLDADEHQLSSSSSSSDESSILSQIHSEIKTLPDTKVRQRNDHERMEESSTSSIIKSRYLPETRRTDISQHVEELPTSSLNRSMAQHSRNPTDRQRDDGKEVDESATSPLNRSTADMSQQREVDGIEQKKEVLTSSLVPPIMKSSHESDTRRRLSVKDNEESSVPSLNRSIPKSLHKSKARRVDNIENVEESATPTSNHSTSNTLHKPKVRRADGSEVIPVSTTNPLQDRSSNVLPYKHCYFPRSLLSRESVHPDTTSKIHSPSPPIEQYNNTQLIYLLDGLENECSPVNFTDMLDQLTLSTVRPDQTKNHTSLTSTDEDEDKENVVIIPNLFDQSSAQDYYTTFTINLDDPRKISLYTMTIGTVQLSPLRIVPYSILSGRRPSLQSSVQTNFKQFRSKRQKYTYQVTAIESFVNTDHLQKNDIILKVNEDSVWNSTTDVIRRIIQEYGKRSNQCSLTIARLCQPSI